MAQRSWASRGSGLGVGDGCYTAYLFAQAKARDLWQSPLLPPHLAVQAVLAGAATLLPFAVWLSPAQGVRALEVVLAVAAALHLVLVWTGRACRTSPLHARLATHEMIAGPLRASCSRLGVVAVVVSVAAPWIGVVAVPFALIGLLAYEHAYVQAGQSVPLA